MGCSGWWGARCEVREGACGTPGMKMEINVVQRSDEGLSFVTLLLLESPNLVLPHPSFVTRANYLTSELQFLKMSMMFVLKSTCVCHPSLGAGRKGQKFYFLFLKVSIFYARFLAFTVCWNNIVHIRNVKGTHVWDANSFFQKGLVVTLKVLRR